MVQIINCPTVTPPWNWIGKKLESGVRKAIFDFHLLDGVTKLAIAVSGGKDSVALLSLLKAITGRGVPYFDIVAVHVDGPFSCGAGVGTEFLKNICQTLNVPLIIKHSAARSIDQLECYSCSRERRKLLFAAAREEGCSTIAFGHHQDDNAQTILMNLFHKGEFAGTLPKISMVDYGITIIRPLIYATEEDIRKFAAHHGFARIMCQCPVGQKSLRKKTEKLLKEIEEFFPHARSNIANAGITYGSQKANNHKRTRD